VTPPPERRSPLGGVAAEADGRCVSLAERAFLGKIALRGDGRDAAFPAAVEDALGFPLPLEPNTAAAGPAATALWLGPDEWLVVTVPGREGPLAAGLAQALSGLHALVLDVSDQRTVIAVSGASAPGILAKGTALDLRPPAFDPGRCAQTRLARALVIVHRPDDAPTYDLYVDRSYADYLWRWLERAARDAPPA